ncbi:DUF3265 domain-containing protein [Vibrio navarrensis]|uniref:hypothetical protein n=1 Tax=Vibrio navarrensis TaxID=29495 RepID=UPI001869E15F|nr:DUF3265 domain-containing protein [Vibrio navarrensis]MBE4590668.1 hypothetical protein [Vibrio navarrensis]
MAQSRFGSFAFALSFLNVCYQNLLFFKANEQLQSLNQFGFQNSSGLLVSQIGLISRLVNLKVLKFKLTNCLSGIRNAWHFQHAVGFVIKAVCGSFSSALLTP